MPESRLVEHYETKYRDADALRVEPVSIVTQPRDRFQSAVRLALQRPGGRYLEIGAGSGTCALALLDRFDGLVLTELAPVRVSALANLFYGNPRVTVLQNDIESAPLPFSNDYFDTVVMVAVIEHLFDPVAALQKLNRVLKPGGRLILDTPNIAKWTRRIKLAAGYFPSTASRDEGLLCYDGHTPTDLYDDGHLHYFTFRSLRRLCLERAGFSRVEAFGYGPRGLGVIWPQMFSEIAIVVWK
jgi:SAM-dependent methyltransferase